MNLIINVSEFQLKELIKNITILNYIFMQHKLNT